MCEIILVVFNTVKKISESYPFFEVQYTSHKPNGFKLHNVMIIKYVHMLRDGIFIKYWLRIVDLNFCTR